MGTDLTLPRRQYLAVVCFSVYISSHCQGLLAGDPLLRAVPGAGADVAQLPGDQLHPAARPQRAVVRHPRHGPRSARGQKVALLQKVPSEGS